MTQTDYTIVIPARYASSRFPGKPLHLINGRPMLLHTADRARESCAGIVVVATDDERICKVCEDDGLDVHMTDAAHPSGTDRIAEVAETRHWPDDMLIVGLQGDEPATSARHLDLLAKNLAANTSADVATLCMPISNPDDYTNPNRVKVVMNCQNMALYFSRSSIPARRKLPAQGAQSALEGADGIPESFLHIGLYAYRCAYLKTYKELTPCLLEKEEQLEQLRMLYFGGQIHVCTIETGPARGVDHPDDIALLEAVLKHGAPDTL
ncbi:MAG: 3-deoxy-manno-octulosonate cytidylyltransferase [Granulosicoccus sp.]